MLSDADRKKIVRLCDALTVVEQTIDDLKSSDDPLLPLLTSSSICDLGRIEKTAKSLQCLSTAEREVWIEILSRAEEVFGSEDHAAGWFTSFSPSLAAVPVDVAAKPGGKTLLLNDLGRIA